MSRLHTRRSTSPQKKVKKAPVPIILAKSPPKEAQMQMLRSVEEIFDGKIDSGVIQMVLTEKSWIVEEAVEILSSMIDEEPPKSRPSAVSQLDLIAFSLLENTPTPGNVNQLPVSEVTSQNSSIRELMSDSNDIDSLSGESMLSTISTSSGFRSNSSDSAERQGSKDCALFPASMPDEFYKNLNGHTIKSADKSDVINACKENNRDPVISSEPNSLSGNHNLKVTPAKIKPKNATAKCVPKDSCAISKPVGQSAISYSNQQLNSYESVASSGQEKVHENASQVGGYEAGISEKKNTIDYSLQSYISMYGGNFGLPEDFLKKSSDNTVLSQLLHTTSKVKVDSERPEQIKPKTPGKDFTQDICCTPDLQLSDSNPHCKLSYKGDEKAFKDFIIPKTRVEELCRVDKKSNAVLKEDILEPEKMFRNSASTCDNYGDTCSKILGYDDSIIGVYNQQPQLMENIINPSSQILQKGACDNYGDACSKILDYDDSIIGVYNQQPQLMENIINPSSQILQKEAGHKAKASQLDSKRFQDDRIELSPHVPVFYSHPAGSYQNSLTGHPFFMMPKSPHIPPAYCPRPKGSSPPYTNAYARPRNQHHLGYAARQLRPNYAHKTHHHQNVPVPKGQPINDGLSKHFVRPPTNTVNYKRSLPPRQLLDKYSREKKKVLVLLRGLPGSGKSYLAREIVGKGIILSTDEFFTQDGVYRYDPNELSSAHTWNKQRAINAMESGASPVIIDNTNTKIWEMKPYAKAATQNGYSVIIMEPETAWKFKARELQARNVHGVTKDVINKMKDRYDMNVTVEQLLASIESGPGTINKPTEIKSEVSKPNSEISEKSFVRPKTLTNSKACDDSSVLKDNTATHFSDLTNGKPRMDTKEQSSELPKPEIVTAGKSQDLTLKPDCDSFWSEPEDIKALEKTPSPKPKRERKQTRHKKIEMNLKEDFSSANTCNHDNQSELIQDINKVVKDFSESSNGDQDGFKDNLMLDVDVKDTVANVEEKIDASFNCAQTNIDGDSKFDEQVFKCEGELDASESDASDENSPKVAKSSSLINKDLKDKFRSQMWNTFAIGEQSAAVLPVIDGENDRTEVVQTSDVGTYTDGSHLDESKKNYLRIVKAKPRDINKTMPITVAPKSIQRVVKLDKGCNTDNILDFQPNLEFLRSSFPHLTDKRIEEILEMCHNDVEWAIELILDYDTPSFTSGEVEEITSEVFKLKSHGIAAKTSSIERADMKCARFPPSLFDICQRVMEQNNIAKEKIQEYLISNGMKRLEKLETHGLQRMRSFSLEEACGTLTKDSKLKTKNSEYYNSVGYVLNRLNREGVINNTESLQMLQGYDESSSESSEGYVTPNDGYVSPVPSAVKLSTILRPKPKQSPKQTSMIFAKQTPAHPSIHYSEQPKSVPDTLIKESSLPILHTSPIEGLGTELSMKIPGEFVNQLQQLFGEILPEKFKSDEDQEVFLDLKAAKQIHRCLKNTIENGSIEKRQQLLNDEALARLIQEDEDKETTKFNRVKKKPQPVNLGDIIQEELHRKVARERHLKYLESTGDHIAIATKLKRQKLLEKFPGLDEGLFEEMFEANGYEDTDAAIKAALGPPIPVKTVLSPEAEEAYYQELIEEAKQKSLLDILETPAYMQVRHKEYQRVDVDRVDYQELRGEANLHHMLRQNCYVKAQEAFQRGMPEVSSFYAQQGRLHGSKIKEANMRASQKILELRRAEVHDNMTLDLHGFHVDEAISALNQVIVQKEKEYTLRPERRRSNLFVITGRGLNSRGGVAKVRPAIISFLSSNNYKYIEEKPGIIKIQLKSR